LHVIPAFSATSIELLQQDVVCTLSLEALQQKAVGSQQQDQAKSSLLNDHTAKVPAVTLGFWVIKIAATTLGETGGDAVSMTLHWGYALSSVMFLAFFLVTVTAQIAVRKLHPFLYWAAVVGTTTAGTTMADFADRSLGIGYVGGSLLLLVLVIVSLVVWKLTVGTVSVAHIVERKAEAFYWCTILFSNTLGTALGDFFADDSGLGFGKSFLLFAAVLVVLALLYFFTPLSRTLLFWLAFILTRPLGATAGDTLTKPIADGGLNLSRPVSSLVIVVLMIVCIQASNILGARPKVGHVST
jgi:uncharacterized membrane-anchored protein